MPVVLVLASFPSIALPCCNVDVPSTPYHKEIRAENRELRSKRRPDSSVQAQGDRWKTAVVAMYREPRHLNPALRTDKWGYRVAMYNIYEPLLRRDPSTGALSPCLATHWSISPDGRLYRFTLRKGVKWHDGRPLTASDVHFSLSRVVAAGVPLGPFRQDIRDAYVRVDMVGPDEIRVVLRRTHSFFLDHLTEYPILPRHVFLKNMYPKSRGSLRPVGTGPFRFESWSRRKQIDLTANRKYWGRVPGIERIRFLLTEDRAKALTLLKRGDIDILYEMIREHYPDQLTDRVKRRFMEVKHDGFGFSYVIWNTRSKILADFRVRRALTMLMDRNRLVNEVLHGLGRVIEGPYPSLSETAAKKAPKPWPYDPITARNLLEKAGWRDRDGDKIRDKNGTPMRIVLLMPVRAFLLKDELNIIGAEFAKSGIDLVQVPTDWSMMQRRLRSGRFMAAALEWSGRPSEDLTALFHSSGRYNFGVITNLMLDRHLMAIRHTGKRSRRAELCAQVERILHSYQPVTFLHSPTHVSLVHRRITDVVIGPDGFDFPSMKLQPKEAKGMSELGPVIPRQQARSSGTGR